MTARAVPSDEPDVPDNYPHPAGALATATEPIASQNGHVPDADWVHAGIPVELLPERGFSR